MPCSSILFNNNISILRYCYLYKIFFQLPEPACELACFYSVEMWSCALLLYHTHLHPLQQSHQIIILVSQTCMKESAITDWTIWTFSAQTVRLLHRNMFLSLTYAKVLIWFIEIYLQLLVMFLVISQNCLIADMQAIFVNTKSISF